MEEDEDVNSSMLWSHISKGIPDSKIYTHLKSILTKLTSHTESREQVFTTRGIAALLKLLSHKNHSPDVYMLTLALIGLLCNVEEKHRYMVNRGVICHIVDLLGRELEPEAEEDPTGPHAKLQIHLYQCVCSMLLYFSNGPLPSKQACLFEGIVPKILKLLTSTDTPRSHILYGFDGHGTETFSRLTSNKQLVAETQPLQNLEFMKDFWQVYLKRSTCDIQSILQLKNSCCEVLSLCDRSGDVNIREELANQNAAWLSDLQIDHKDQEEKHRQVIHVCHVVNPMYFFAQLGEEAKVYVSRIQASINIVAESRRKFLRHPPKPGIFIAAVHEHHGCYRGIVLQSSESKTTVYGLDFGFIEELDYRELFLLTDAMRMPPYPPQATLCRLKGLKPKFLHTSIGVVALKALSNLSCMELAAPHFFKPLAIDQLYKLCQCCDWELTDKVHGIFCNLCKYEKIREQLCEKHIVATILVTLKRCASRLTCKTNERAAKSGLGLLINLFFHSDLAKAQLVQIEGLDTLLKLTRPPTVQSVRLLALKALRSFLGRRSCKSPREMRDSDLEEEDPPDPITVMKGYIAPIRKKPQSHPIVRSVNIHSEEAGDGKLQMRNATTSSDTDTPYERSTLNQDRKRIPANEIIKFGHTSLYSTERQKPASQRRSRSRSIGKPKPDDEIEILVKANLRQESDSSEDESLKEYQAAGGPSCHNSTEDDISGSNTDGETVIRSQRKQPKVENTSELYRQKMYNNYYVQDSVVDFVPGEEIEIRTVKNMSRVSSTGITKIAIGFLNSGHGGHIYFGITSDGRVRGNKINREERDEFRQGVDRVFKDRIVPQCVCDQYDIKFIPVIRKLDHPDSSARIKVQDHYVIEILINKATNHTVYANKEDEIFFRHGADTVSACALDIQTRVVEDLEEDYLQYIDYLKKEIRKTQEKTQEKFSEIIGK